MIVYRNYVIARKDRYNLCLYKLYVSDGIGKFEKYKTNPKESIKVKQLGYYPNMDVAIKVLCNICIDNALCNDEIIELKNIKTYIKDVKEDILSNIKLDNEELLASKPLFSKNEHFLNYIKDINNNEEELNKFITTYNIPNLIQEEDDEDDLTDDEEE